jgi:putative transposase
MALVYDNNGQDAIAKSMQLIAARTGQEYNIRKQRKGAFWEDRYQATAIEQNSHLNRCLVYIDLNMVRAGVVDHPQMWPFCGYSEIQNPPRRYRIIDPDSLTRLVGFEKLQDFQLVHKKWIEAALSVGESEREGDWSESIAVGGKTFIENVKKRLGFKAKGRAISINNDRYQLRDNISDDGNTPSHGSGTDPRSHVGIDNAFCWNDKS